MKDGKVGAPVKGATLIGDGATALRRSAAIGNDMALDPGMGNCGKNGQWVPVGVGLPTHPDRRPDRRRQRGVTPTGFAVREAAAGELPALARLWQAGWHEAHDRLVPPALGPFDLEVVVLSKPLVAGGTVCTV